MDLFLQEILEGRIGALGSQLLDAGHAERQAAPLPLTTALEHFPDEFES